jgi:tRNA (cmo5U34)-methyltransferase
MDGEIPDRQASWSEDDSRLFQELGGVFVPQRELQFRILTQLVPRLPEASVVVELCCGDGALAERLLDAFPEVEVRGFDGSPAMLAAAERRLARFGARWRGREFDLRTFDGSGLDRPVRAVVSSLAVHHLEGVEKAALYRRVRELLAPGGALLVADLVLPASPAASALAADLWDETTHAQAASEAPGRGAWERFVELRWNFFRHPDDVDKPSPLGDHLRWLAAAGFDGVDVFWAHAGHAVYGGFKPESASAGDTLGG